MWLALPPVAIAAWIGVLKLIMALAPQPPGVTPGPMPPNHRHGGARAGGRLGLRLVALRALRETDLPGRLLRAEVCR